MGACLSRKHTVLEQPPGLVRQSSSSFYTIRDQFTDIEQVCRTTRLTRSTTEEPGGSAGQFSPGCRDAI